jgi:hypothetical protein
MISQHTAFQQPPDKNISIWRYMNLSNFVWMLQNEGLYFCRCDLLGDPYEGHYTQPVAASEADFVGTMLAIPEFNRIPDAEEIARDHFKVQLLDLPKKLKSEFFVSCWHMNDEESQAMWKLYTSHNESICVRSTYQTLADALPAECMLGQVKYIDYRRDRFDTGNALNYIVHKRKSFEHEREARSVVWKRDGATLPFESVGAEGLVVPVNIGELVKEIFVSPGSKPMLREIVEKLATKYGLTVPVKQSAVDNPPGY